MCRYCTFDNWITPYGSDKNPVYVCGKEHNGHGDYVVARPNGVFYLMTYFYDNGCFEIDYCPYCGAKLVKPDDEVFAKAEREYRERQRQNKIAEPK